MGPEYIYTHTHTHTFQRMTLNYIRRVLYATGDLNGMKITKLTKEFCVTGQNKGIKNLCKIQKLGE